MKVTRFSTLCLIPLMAAAIAGADAPAAAPARVPDVKDYFYVYAPKSRHEMNHYAPSGWMGDVNDLRYEEAKNPAKPEDTVAKVSYSAKGSKGAGWAGIFWQNPNNNWGSRPGGFNLSQFKKLTFLARGAKGGEKISEFKVGGISGDYGDTDSAVLGPVELTKDWKTYTIDLSGKDLSRIIGGFCFSTSRDDNPDGFVIFLSDIRFEH